MSQWEYKVEGPGFGVAKNTELYYQWLNDWGREGWELISRGASDREEDHVFKRRISLPHDYRRAAS